MEDYPLGRVSAIGVTGVDVPNHVEPVNLRRYQTRGPPPDAVQPVPGVDPSSHGRPSGGYHDSLSGQSVSGVIYQMFNGRVIHQRIPWDPAVLDVSV